MTVPDDDLESIADATDIHGNVGTRGSTGSKRGSPMPWYQNSERAKLRRLFAKLKADATRKQNKAIAQRPAHD